MAENDSNGGWWNGWMQAAKEKSASAFEFVKKDLTEFTSTMQHDTTAVATDVKSKLTPEQALAATKKAKDGVSQLFGGITKVLTVEAEDKPTKSRTSLHSKPIFDRAQARRNTIQLDPGTYCDKPQGSQEEYDTWVSTFHLEGKKGDISELLVVNVEVRALYTQLVPSKVSHADFWQRYFYKLHQLDKDEKRKADLMKRADDAQEQIDWDEEDDWGDLEGPSSPPTQGGMHLAAKELEKSKATAQRKDDECSITSSETPSDIVVPEEEENVNVKDSDKVSIEEKNGNLDSDKALIEDKNVNNDESKEMQQLNEQSSQRPNAKTETFENMSTDLDKKASEKMSESSAINVEASRQSKIEQALSPTDDSSLSISSITDSSVPDHVKQMESSSDTLTLVSPLEEVAVETSTIKSESHAAPALTSDISGSAAQVIDSISDESIRECKEEKELKTKVKGDLVVVGSGASSERTTPSSTASSNKETEDDWEKEFEVTEDELSQHTTTKLTVDTTENEDMEDDWESWD